MSASPAEIDEYRLLRLLGRGGMGEVYLAEDTRLDRLVAIKLIGRVHYPDARARFAIEARAVARLKHPNVVTVYRTGEYDGRPYLVSEYVEGKTLDKISRPLAYEDAISLALQLTRGLAAAHRENILHRDVKPANAIVDATGTVKLLDFGLAKLSTSSPSEVRSNARTPEASTSSSTPSSPRAAATEGATKATNEATGSTLTATAPTTGARDDRPSADASTMLARRGPPRSELSTITFSGPSSAPLEGSIELTSAGSQLGTPRYMSPEAWHGEPMTAASDVYSLGLVLWELFAGRHPFEGLASAEQSIRVCGDDVPSIREAISSLPPALAAVIDRCVRCAPAARYPDAGALLVDLEAAVASRRPRPWRLVGGLAFTGVVGAIFLGTRMPGDERRAAAPSTPRALTSHGGCLMEPTFIDNATLAFTLRVDDHVDVMTSALTRASVLTPLAASKGWDWRASPGLMPNEVLYVRDGDDGQFELMTIERASRISTRLGNASSAVAVDGTVYLLDTASPGQVLALGPNGPTPFAELPAGSSPFLLTGTNGVRHLAVIVADPESPPGLCIVDLDTKAVRCPATQALQNGRPAFTRDGRFVYYAAREGIRRLDLADGDRDQLVVPGVRASGGLTLSPDQRHLVYSDCRSYGSIIAIGQGAPEVLVGASLVTHPGAGPHGLLGWITARKGGGTRLVVRSADGTERELAEAPTEIGRPAFDADGANVAYTVGGEDGGVRTVAVTGGAPTTWTTSKLDRGPQWLADGGLAFTRYGKRMRPEVVYLRSPESSPRTLLEGWELWDVDPAGQHLLVSRNGATELAVYSMAESSFHPVALGEAGKFPLEGGQFARDGGGYIVLGGPFVGTFYHVDLQGQARVLYELPSAQGASPPTVLSDGRVAFRPEIWLGELYAVEGDWAAPAHRR